MLKNYVLLSMGTMDLELGSKTLTSINISSYLIFCHPSCEAVSSIRGCQRNTALRVSAASIEKQKSGEGVSSIRCQKQI